MTATRLFLLELCIGVALAVPLAFGMRDALTVMSPAAWLGNVLLLSAAIAVLVVTSSQTVRDARQEARRG